MVIADEVDDAPAPADGWGDLVRDEVTARLTGTHSLLYKRMLKMGQLVVAICCHLLTANTRREAITLLAKVCKVLRITGDEIQHRLDCERERWKGQKGQWLEQSHRLEADARKRDWGSDDTL